jgi:hypothetical protein
MHEINGSDSRLNQRAQKKHFFMIIHRRAFPSVWVSSSIAKLASDRFAEAPGSCIDVELVNNIILAYIGTQPTIDILFIAVREGIDHERS